MWCEFSSVHCGNHGVWREGILGLPFQDTAWVIFRKRHIGFSQYHSLDSNECIKWPIAT